ncbi:TAP-like protein [Sarocladium implicatum]|nr:TAP-like protein [Sarocladium implicatum]
MLRSRAGGGDSEGDRKAPHAPEDRPRLPGFDHMRDCYRSDHGEYTPTLWLVWVRPVLSPGTFVDIQRHRYPFTTSCSRRSHQRTTLHSSSSPNPQSRLIFVHLLAYFTSAKYRDIDIMVRSIDLLAAAIAGATAAQVSDFDWSAITPSASLNYTSCYDGFKCARLEVPLDWLNTTNPARVTLAVIAFPAVVSDDDPKFGGTIFTNPGGPSGSGVGFLLRNAGSLQGTADSDEKKFEILSFDPRGVGETLPRSDCWENEYSRQSYSTEEVAMGSPDELHNPGRIFARSKGFGKLCEQNDGGENDIRNFMSTSSVARDMVEMADKIDELRHPAEADRQDEGQLELRSEKKDVPRVNYWGFSYGSVLGNYFASMFPERIGHVALETWSRNLQDTPHTYAHLFDTCYAARDKCALYTPSDTSPSSIRERFESWLDDLEVSPSFFVGTSAVHDINRWNVLLAIIRPLYAPMAMFPKTAEILAEAMNGNFSGILEAALVDGFSEECPLKIPSDYTWSRDAQAAIACGDAVDQSDLTVPDFKDYIDLLKGQDRHVGPFWSLIRGNCLGWRYRPKYAFSGPWTTPEHDPRGVPGKPLAPLLFVSSKYDPVTPLRNAFAMSKFHPGSGVLVQDNVGHGTLGTPGKCRDEAIKRFFAKGEVPDGELRCEADCTPFQECEGADVKVLGVEGFSQRRRAPLEVMW